VPIIVKNKLIKVYEIQRKIEQMLKKNLPYEEVNWEIGKLLKYSYNMYV